MIIVVDGHSVARLNCNQYTLVRMSPRSHEFRITVWGIDESSPNIRTLELGNNYFATPQIGVLGRGSSVGFIGSLPIPTTTEKKYLRVWLYESPASDGPIAEFKELRFVAPLIAQSP